MTVNEPPPVKIAPQPHHDSATALARLFADARGAVLLEYSIVVGAVALAGAVGLLLVGIAVLNSFGFVRALLLSAIP